MNLQQHYTNDNRGNVVEHYKENVTTKYNYDFQELLVGYKETSGKAAYQSFDSKDSKQYSFTYDSNDMIQLASGITYYYSYYELGNITQVRRSTEQTPVQSYVEYYL